jgi:hypothetical protein
MLLCRDAKFLRCLHQDRALFVDRLGELVRPARIWNLSGHDKTVRDNRIGVHHRLDVRRNGLAQFFWYRGRAKQPDQPIYRQCRLAGLRDGRDVGYR